MIVGLILLVGQAWLDDRRSDRETSTARIMAEEAERRENLRFVRERSNRDSLERPYTNIDLVGQNLAKLNMANADLENARLTEAFMPSVNLSGANLRTADLSGALLGGANLENADFLGADLRGTNLENATLQGAVLEATCYDQATKWPTGFAPPPSEAGLCDLHDEVYRSAAIP